MILLDYLCRCGPQLNIFLNLTNMTCAKLFFLLYILLDIVSLILSGFGIRNTTEEHCDKVGGNSQRR